MPDDVLAAVRAHVAARLAECRAARETWARGEPEAEDLTVAGRLAQIAVIRARIEVLEGVERVLGGESG